MNHIASRNDCVPLQWVAVVVALLVAWVYGTGLAVSPASADVAEQVLAPLALVGVFAAVIVFSVIANRRYVGEPLLSWPGWRCFGIEATVAAAATVAWLAVGRAVFELFPELGRLVADGRALRAPVIIAPVAYALIGVILAPLAEEMFFRGVLYRSLRPWLAPIFAALAQAAAFAALHRFTWMHAVLAFGSAMLFMGLYLWRRTLWTPVLAHAGMNAAGVIPLLVLLVLTSRQPFMGVATVEQPDRPGVDVTHVVAFSAAEAAGIRAGDVIVSFNGHDIETPADMSEQVAICRAGDRARVKLVRGEEAHEVWVTLRARRPKILW